MKKKIIPVLVAVFLMLVIGGAAVGKMLYDKYSYSKEVADLSEYYQVSGEQSAIILQDEMVEEKAIIRNGVCYLDLATVRKYLNEIFYVDMGEELLLYTDAVDTVRVQFGASTYESAQGSADAGYTIVYAENETVYLALDFVKKYTNFSYDIYDYRIQMYTDWGTKTVADVAKATAVRTKGGVKSPILTQLAQGDTVEVLEQMETWSKVKTADSIIGYVENKRLTEVYEVEETPLTDYVAPEYTSIAMDGKVSLGWHSIGGVGGNDTLWSMISESKGMNVIAPTWFSLNDNEGNFRSFASADYVKNAHAAGLQVWGVLDNFNYDLENDVTIDEFTILSSTSRRQKLVEGICKEAVRLGLDGVNLDFEELPTGCGIHYAQFLRELSVLCRKNELVLSIANHVPFSYNDGLYRLDVQGQVADYVIIMGYDEHLSGGAIPGSVASIDYVTFGIDRALEMVPAAKVVNALPFYTYVWKTNGADIEPANLTIDNVADFLKRIKVEPVWDEETCQNYVEWTDGSEFCQVWLEDAESIMVKLNVMRTKEIGGVAVWCLGNGTPVVWELIKAYVNS